MLHSKVAPKWISALFLAIGVGVVWGVAVGVGGSIIYGFLPRGRITPENVVVAADGTPLIQSQIAGNYYNTKLRTLDNQTVELEEENWLEGSTIHAPYRGPGLVELPIAWQERIAGCSDFGKPPENWILMRDDRRPGHAYFTGYDTESKLHIGYIGTQGFRPSVPAEDQQFDLGNLVLSWFSGAVTSAGPIQIGGELGRSITGHRPEENRTLAPWLAFIIDGDVIQEVNLRNRKVRPIQEFKNLLAVGIASQPLPSKSQEQDGAKDEREETDSQTQQTQPALHLAAMQDIFALQATPMARVNSKHKTAHRLLARCTDRIVALNPFDGSQQEFPLPESLRHTQFTAYLVAADRLLLQVSSGYWEHGNVVDLLWLNPNGETTREVTLQLAGYSGPAERREVLTMTAIVPSLICFVVVAAGVAPLVMMQSHEADSYLSGLSESVQVCWPALIVLILLSAVLTWFVYRWQKRYCRGNTGLWCATVFFTTAPGILAYWLMHRGTMLEPCKECGQPAPRDRDACAHCETPFAAPQRLGTEII